MSGLQSTTGRWTRGGVMALVVLLAGCGYAKREDVENELAQLRQEMEAGDQALAARLDNVEGRMAALERELQAMRDEFNVQVERFEGLLSFNVPVHFQFAEADVRPSDMEVLDRFAAVVREFYPNAVVTVEGFTDPAGSRAYNQRLGQARADAVREYLTSNGGLPGDRVRAVSYGEDSERLVVPGAQGPGEPGMANRRVSLVIDYSGTDAPADRTRTDGDR